MMNLHRLSLVSVALLAPLFLVAFVVTADDDSDLLLPKNYRDDVYHCTDPVTNNNQGGKNLLMTCDPITYLWNINELKPNKQPDNSELCTELIGILLRSKEKEELQKEAGQLDANVNLDVTVRNDIQMWESIMDNSVVDQLEPCVLWAMTYGSLTQYSSSIEINLNNKEQPTSLLPIDFDPIVITLVWDETFISFEPDTTNPLSIDRVELHDITGQHMVEALKAELHDNDNYGGVQFLDLSVSAGLPNYDTRTLPLTLTGQVTFQNIRQAILDPASLRRVLLQAAFKNTNANELYLFRLKIANDPTLQNVVSVLAGKDELIQYTLQHNNGDRIDFNDFSPINTDTSTEEGFVSVLLIVIIVAVGVSIIAVVCFIYCLICRKQSPGRRSRTSGKAAKTLEENSLVDQLPPSVITGIPTNINGRYRKSDKQQQKKEKKKLLSSSTNKSKNNNNNNNKRRSPRQSNRGRGRYASMSASSHVSDDNDKNNNYYDKYGEVPAVRTAPTQEMMMGEEGGGEYDIEFNFAGSNIDDGISEYDMETLPPPSTHVPDTDDEASQVDDTMMSIMDGMVDNVDDYNNYNNGDDDDDDSDGKTVASSNVGGDYDDNISDAGTSLYSYIPDDTSLTASLVNGPFSSQFQKKQPDLQQQQQQTTMERAQKKSILWSVMDSLNVTKAPPDASDTDNEGESVYIDDMTFIADDYNNKEKNFNSSTTTAIMKNNHTKTMLGNEDNDSFTSSKDSNSLLYKNTAEVEAVVNAAPKYPEEEKKQFEQIWKQDTTATTEDANATSVVVVEKEASIQATTPEKEENNGNSEEMAAVSTAKRGNKTIESNNGIDIDNIDARGHDDDNKGGEIADASAVLESSGAEDSQPKEGASTSEAVVDWVPEEKKVEEIDDDGGDEDEDNNRVLPLPTTLESSFLKESGIIFDARDVSSVSSGVSETSHQSNASITRKGESARRKKSSKWGATAATSPSSASVVSCGGSVCSTDSSKLRSLLGQSDTNDAALVFGKQQQNSTNKNDESSSSAGSNATPESEVSMSSCTSNQLKSLLTRTDSKDSAEDEDFLFRQNKETIETNNDVVRRTVQEEEKKEDFVDEENYDDDDDDDCQKNAYLPVSMRPVTPSQNNYDDDSTAVSVYSALSDAPSVDESISSNMGWF